MAYVFYALGAFAMLVGIVWTGTVLSAPADTTNGIAVLAKLAVATPGLSFILSGLLFLAIGSGLRMLGRITRNTSETVQLLEDMIK